MKNISTMAKSGYNQLYEVWKKNHHVQVNIIYVKQPQPIQIKNTYKTFLKSNKEMANKLTLIA